jgi:nucleoside-diphosphate-sugar epimerase
MTKRAMLLGGSGAMGRYLAPALVRAGFEVDVTTRTQRFSTAEGIKYVLGDAHDFGFLSALLARHRYEVLVDFMVYSTDEFTDRLPTLLTGADQYVFVSSYRIFADAPVLTERSPRILDVCRDRTYLATDEYALSKARQEDALRATRARNWTIVRPGITYSTGRFQLGTLEADMTVWRSLRRVPIALPAQMLSKQTTLTWAGDVAELIARLAGTADALGDDFNVVTTEHHPWSEVAQIYHEVLGTEVQAVDTEDYIKALGGGFNCYQVHYDRLFDRVLDNRKVLAATGYSQPDFTPLRTGLRAELKRFLEYPSPLPIDFGRQARFDALTNSFIGFGGLNARDVMSYMAHRIPGVRRTVGPARDALRGILPPRRR